MRQPRPPLFLERYRESALHRKMEFAHAILRWAMNWLNEVQEMTPDAAFDGLAHAKKIRRTAKSIEKTFEEAALAEMFHAGTTRHKGKDYEAVMQTGRDRKNWKHPDVMDALIEANIERMQGRFPYVPQDLLRTLVTESMWEVHKHGRIDWRSTDLRKSGIDPDDFSERTQERPTIDLRGAGSYPTSARRRPRGV